MRAIRQLAARLFLVLSPVVVVVVRRLEDDPQPELDLSGSTKRIDTGSDTDAIHVVARGCSTVDLSRRSRQHPIECISG